MSIESEEWPEPEPAWNNLAEILAQLRLKCRLRYAEIARLIDVRPETISRWNRERSFLPQARTWGRLMELEYLIDEVAEFFEPEQARQWLFSAQPALGGAVPVDLVQMGQTHAILRILSDMRLKKERARHARKRREREKAHPVAIEPVPEGWRSPLLNPPVAGEEG